MNGQVRYPWQQTILDVYMSPQESIAAKISIAEQAIAARIAGNPQPDTLERVALDHGLKMLKGLAGRDDTARKGLHYHIKWSTKEVLDWEAFGSQPEAEAAAQQLVRPYETYSVVERDESCPRCWKNFKLKRSDPDPNGTYPWQQAVWDALAETSPEQLIRKVNVAQRAISARLMDFTPSDLNEQLAIRDALRCLRQLIPEPKKDSKREIA